MLTIETVKLLLIDQQCLLDEFSSPPIGPPEQNVRNGG